MQLVLQVPELGHLDVHQNEVAELRQVAPVDLLVLHLAVVLDRAASLLAVLLGSLLLCECELPLQHLSIALVVGQATRLQLLSGLSPGRGLRLCFLSSLKGIGLLQVPLNFVHDLADLDELGEARKH